MKARRGGTLTNILLAVAIAVVVIAMILPQLGRTDRCGARHIKDSTQVRGIHQGMLLWAQSNGPSPDDAARATDAANLAYMQGGFATWARTHGADRPTPFLRAPR